MTAPANNSQPTVIRNSNGNIEIKITLPWSEINRVLEIKTREAIAQTQIPGFRKGMAPREMVEPKLDRSELTSKALGDLLPKAYSQIVKDHDLKPILYPQIKIEQGKTGENWEFTAVTCETPVVTLPDYKSGLAAVSAKSDQSALSAAVDYLKKNTPVTIPDILVEEEANHRLASLAENITQIGLSMEKYLQTKKLAVTDLKAQTAQSARADLETEFILAQIQTEEKLTDRTKTVEFIQSLVSRAK